MPQNKQNRFRSKLLWMAVFAQVISLCELTGFFKAIGIDAGVVGDVVAIVLQILTLVGVLNNPENSEAF